jgi:hypothetical protein
MKIGQQISTAYTDAANSVSKTMSNAGKTGSAIAGVIKDFKMPTVANVKAEKTKAKEAKLEAKQEAKQEAKDKIEWDFNNGIKSVIQSNIGLAEEEGDLGDAYRNLKYASSISEKKVALVKFNEILYYVGKEGLRTICVLGNFSSSLLSCQSYYPYLVKKMKLQE